MQISRCIHTEISQEGVVWAGAAGTGDGVEGTGEAKGKRGHRRALDGGSCASVGIDTAEVFGGAGDGVCEGQKRHSRRSGVCWPKEKFCGPALLGEGILGIDGGEERSGSASLHSGTREGRSAYRPTDADAALSG